MEKETAMKILKELHGKSLFAERTALETLVPELKESEDEKIRKALVRFHKSTIDIDGIKGADILAWIEKQGEKMPVGKPTLKFKVGDKVRLMTLDEIRNMEGVVCKRNERGEEMFLNRNYHAKVWIHFGEWLLPYLGKSFVIEKILGDCVEVPHNICYLQDWLFVKEE